jgi:hypothetical protein
VSRPCSQLPVLRERAGDRHGGEEHAGGEEAGRGVSAHERHEQQQDHGEELEAGQHEGRREERARKLPASAGIAVHCPSNEKGTRTASAPTKHARPAPGSM